MNNHFEDLVNILKKLRSPDGCDWDRAQNHESLIPYLLEEVYEVIEAIENKDDNLLKEELGDLLLHVVFQAELASEKKKFDIYDSIQNINEKLINRHPHIFSDDAQDKNWGVGNWELQKKKEKKRNSVLEGVPKALPALTKARRIQEKASGVGFDWDTIDQVYHKLYEEIDELKHAIKLKNKHNIEEELGDVLFSIVNLSRHINVNPEVALDKSIIKFIARFQKLEKFIDSQKMEFKEQSLSDLDKLWEKIKLKEKSSLE
tara:strand:+ start:103 stop:882 length:780 start_codon:yes stop_codon:yes gene_type:complete